MPNPSALSKSLDLLQGDDKYTKSTRDYLSFLQNHQYKMSFETFSLLESNLESIVNSPSPSLDIGSIKQSLSTFGPKLTDEILDYHCRQAMILSTLWGLFFTIGTVSLTLAFIFAPTNYFFIGLLATVVSLAVLHCFITPAEISNLSELKNSHKEILKISQMGLFSSNDAQDKIKNDLCENIDANEIPFCGS